MIKQVKNLVIINLDNQIEGGSDNQILKKELTLKKYLICSLEVVFLNLVCIADTDTQEVNIINQDNNNVNNMDMVNNKAMITLLLS